MLLSLLAAWVYRETDDYNEPGFNATMTFVCGFVVVAVLNGMLFPSIFIHYETEFVKPLEKSDTGSYYKTSTLGGESAYKFKTVNGPVRTVSDESDEDGSDDEVNLYYTNGQPRLVQRCSYPDSWVVPFGWEWKGYNGCDLNLYVPIEGEDARW